MKWFFAICAVGPVTVASADECSPPPVVQAAQAECLAQQYARSSNPWELRFKTEEQRDLWLVSFFPKSSSVRGGAGDLKIDKATGKVTVVQLYK